MPSERIQRRIDALLDEADEAYSNHDWEQAENRARTALGLEPDNEDALAILSAIESHIERNGFDGLSRNESVTLELQLLDDICIHWVRPMGKPRKVEVTA